MRRYIFITAAIFMMLIFSACSRGGGDATGQLLETPEYSEHIFELTPLPPNSAEPTTQEEYPGVRQAQVTPPPAQVDFSPSLSAIPLIFNTPRVIYICDEPPYLEYDFMVMLRYEQIRTVFGVIAERLQYSGGFAKVFYRNDGSIIEVEATFNLSQWPLYQPLTIQVGMDNPPIGWHSFRTYQFSDDAVFMYSFVSGIPVIVRMVESYRHTVMNFDANFILDDMYFRVRFYETEQRGRPRLYEVLAALIDGGTDGFEILQNPEIPETFQSLTPVRVRMALPEGFGNMPCD